VGGWRITEQGQGLDCIPDLDQHIVKGSALGGGGGGGAGTVNLGEGRGYIKLGK